MGRPPGGRPKSGLAYDAAERKVDRRDMQRQSLISISVVDDDVSSRESLPDLLQMLGFAAVGFASAEEFLASDALGATQCLILDVSMPGMSGPELQSELRRRELNIPIIFITAQCDPTLRAELLSRGAVECLFKPFPEQDLRSALKRAIGSG
jgi:FixJ family two-component response regulator